MIGFVSQLLLGRAAGAARTFESSYNRGRTRDERGRRFDEADFAAHVCRSGALDVGPGGSAGTGQWGESSQSGSTPMEGIIGRRRWIRVSRRAVAADQVERA